MNLDREETAYHEAGHVVADFVQGFDLYKASIKPSGTLSGYARGEAEWASGAMDEEAIVSLLAGLAANRLLRPFISIEDGGATLDYERVQELLPFVKSDLHSLENRAVELAKQNQGMIEAVAELLLAEEEVSGDDLTTVCLSSLDGTDWHEQLAICRAKVAQRREPS